MRLSKVVRTIVFLGLGGAAAYLAICLVYTRVAEADIRARHATRLLALADAAQLIGRPQSDVEVVLGAADNTLEYGTEPVTTYEYWAMPLRFAGALQVHCKNGVVDSIEPYDD